VSVKTLKHITVNERNYHTLKRLGNAGDSFNDVVTKLLKKLDMEEESDEEEEAGVND
jgi:predicted CopG family antitoxin